MESGTKSLPESILDYIEFFRDRGYLVSSDFAERFFDTACAVGVQNYKINELEPILRTMTVQTAEQFANFPLDFDDFIHNRKKKMSAAEMEKQVQEYKTAKSKLSNMRNVRDELEEDIRNLEKKLESIEKRQDQFSLDEKTIKSLLKNREKTGGDFQKLFEHIHNEKLRDALENLTTIHQFPKSEIQSKIMYLMRYCIGVPNGANMMKHLEKVWNARNKLKDEDNVRSEKFAIKSDLGQKQTQAEKIRQQIKEMERVQEEAESNKLLLKWQSYIHREEFRPGNAVQAISRDLPDFFDKSFTKLNDKEKDQIKAYIYENAREFRTRMARNIRTGLRRKLDIAETCKAACATDGVPMRLRYEKPVRSKANLVLFLDISGSCSAASELMLFFMYCMHDVFPGGCRAYVFVNSLYDISEYLEAGDPDMAVKNILGQIPTRGVYSDYYTPLKDFHENHFSEINKDSLIFFIGDARNNKNPTGEEHLKEICRKCRKAFWMNTDDEAWNSGDSIIGVYQPYLRSVSKVLTPAALIQCLDGIRSM